MNEPFDRGLESSLDPDAASEPPFKVLSPQEASALRARLVRVSPWQILAAQAAVGLLCALIAWGVTRSGQVAASALYGVAVVVLPGGLLARGMARGMGNPAAAAAAFLFWELVKLVVAVAMLAAAAMLAPGLSWTALLLTMVVCMKMGWLALLGRRPPVVTETQQKRV